MVKTQRSVKENVMQAGRGLFARYGFRKTTMDEIARAAHMAKSSIYHYFRSKEEVFAAIMEGESMAQLEEVTRLIRTETNIPEKLRIFFRFRLQAVDETATFYSAVIHEYFEFYPVIEKIRKEMDRQEQNLLRSILIQGIEAGLFKPADLEGAITGLWMALRAIEIYFIGVEKNFDKVNSIQEQLLDILIFGIMKR